MLRSYRPSYTPKAVPTYIPWMIQYAALGKSKPFECWVSEEAAIQIMYFKDVVQGTEILYYAPKEQIKTNAIAYQREHNYQPSST